MERNSLSTPLSTELLHDPESQASLNQKIVTDILHQFTSFVHANQADDIVVADAAIYILIGLTRYLDRCWFGSEVIKKAGLRKVTTTASTTSDGHFRAINRPNIGRGLIDTVQEKEKVRDDNDGEEREEEDENEEEEKEEEKEKERKEEGRKEKNRDNTHQVDVGSGVDPTTPISTDSDFDEARVDKRPLTTPSPSAKLTLGLTPAVGAQTLEQRRDTFLTRLRAVQITVRKNNSEIITGFEEKTVEAIKTFFFKEIFGPSAIHRLNVLVKAYNDRDDNQLDYGVGQRALQAHYNPHTLEQFRHLFFLLAQYSQVQIGRKTTLQHFAEINVNIRLHKEFTDIVASCRGSEQKEIQDYLAERGFTAEVGKSYATVVTNYLSHETGIAPSRLKNIIQTMQGPSKLVDDYGWGVLALIPVNAWYRMNRWGNQRMKAVYRILNEVMNPDARQLCEVLERHIINPIQQGAQQIRLEPIRIPRKKEPDESLLHLLEVAIVLPDVTMSAVPGDEGRMKELNDIRMKNAPDVDIDVEDSDSTDADKDEEEDEGEEGDGDQEKGGDKNEAENREDKEKGQDDENDDKVLDKKPDEEQNIYQDNGDVTMTSN